jgi:DNA-binding NarL/FixJ family response regulator
MLTTSGVITVMPVDGHGAGAGVTARLGDGFAVVAHATTADEAVVLAAALRPDVILMEVALDGGDGMSATRDIVAADPTATVIVWTSVVDADLVRAALDAGAAGYLLKESDAGALADGIRAAARGGCPLHPKVARIALQARASARPARPLSDRERDVLALVAGGLANKQIAARLGIAERTVKAHLTNIFSRLGVRDRTHAALWAQRHLSYR